MGESNSVVHRLEAIVLVAVGGFAGSNLRYFVDLQLSGLLATVTVNTLGSIALGAIVYEATSTDLLADETRTLVATGVLSSFTTYSTFAVQSIQSSPRLLVANVLGTYTLGFAGVLVGKRLVATLERRWVDGSP
jgi:CrcB protein